MRSVVLIKHVPDTYGPAELDASTGGVDRGSGEQVFDEITQRALEVALQQRESHGGDVIALTMGPAGAAESLRKALAMGADRAVHIEDDGLRGSDVLRTSEVLAAAVRRLGADAVIAGDRSSDGQGGVLPARLAERLGIAQATYLSAFAIEGGLLTGERVTDAGTTTIRAALPVVVSVTEKSAEPRYPNFRGIMKAKRKPLDVWSADDLGVAGGHASAMSLVSVAARPPRQAGARVHDDGSAGRQLADFLSSSGLI